MDNFSKANPRHFFSSRELFTFISISLFYLFETAQMSYYNVLAPAYLNHDVYGHASIAALSAAYYYGDMVGLFPVGYALDRFPLRTSLIVALIGTIIGSFLLFMSDSFAMQWAARFICGFFGGTFSFIGGIRIITLMFSGRFTYFMSMFFTAGILGAMLCQYPLLLVVNHFGPRNAMFIMFFTGAAIAIFNWFFLHPPAHLPDGHENKKYPGTIWQMCKEIGLNIRNWADVLMIVLLETPATIIGTLWGVVLMTDFFHVSPEVGSGIVTAMLAGSVIGLPLLGNLADKYGNPPWMVTLGASVCFVLTGMLFLLHHASYPWIIAILFFALGVFSSCQTIGFQWVIKNMKPELISRNSAFNSVIFMATNGGFKQFGAFLLGIAPILLPRAGASGNLLMCILVSMLIVVFYLAVLRRFVSKKI